MALAALREDKTLAEPSKQFELHPNQITESKRQLPEHAADAFGGDTQAAQPVDLTPLHAKIGQLALENDSQSVYGSPRVHCDLREGGVLCGEKRIARLMRQAKLRSVRGYKRPRFGVGMPATTAPNRLQREFTVEQPDQVWVTDITYIRTHEGWLYLTVVIDLYSRAVVGWSMNSTMAAEVVLDAMMTAVWRIRPKTPVMIHSDQGSQFGSDDFNRWCKDNKLVPSMSRRGNCWALHLLLDIGASMRLPSLSSVA